MTKVLGPLEGVASVQRQEHVYRMKCASGERLVPIAVEACTRAGAVVAGVTMKRPSLDEVFLEFTGREFREEEGGPTATDRAVMMQRVRGAMGGRR